MNIVIEIKNQDGNVFTRTVPRSYLVRFVKPKQIYPVNYKTLQDGTRVNEPGFLRGADLTENQIAELFAKQLL